MLVSVAVVTYCSEEHIIELLNSIYNQTYSEIELVISDDCSKDNTVQICKKWLKEHKERFVHTELITIDKNSGLTPNLNRALKVCRGTWIKTIGGDDILEKHAIEEFVRETKQCDEKVIFSGMSFFKDKDKAFRMYPNEDEVRAFTMSNAEMMKRFVFEGNFLPAPAAFFHSDVFSTLGYYDERILFIEDFPFWIKYISKGFSFRLIQKPLIRYRSHENSISGSQQIGMSKRYADSLRLVQELYIKPLLKQSRLLSLVVKIRCIRLQSTHRIVKKIMFKLENVLLSRCNNFNFEKLSYENNF